MNEQSIITKFLSRSSLWSASKKGITIGGITLGASEQDRSLFSQALTLLRETETSLPDEPSKEAFRASNQVIADISGAPHVMTVAAVRQLLIAYGAAYQTLWNAAHTPPE